MMTRPMKVYSSAESTVAPLVHLPIGSLGVADRERQFVGSSAHRCTDTAECLGAAGGGISRRRRAEVSAVAQSGFVCQEPGLGAVGAVQLGQDLRDVVLDRALRQVHA